MRLSNYLASCMRNYRIRDNPFRANFTYLARWANLAIIGGATLSLIQAPAPRLPPSSPKVPPNLDPGKPPAKLVSGVFPFYAANGLTCPRRLRNASLFSASHRSTALCSPSQYSGSVRVAAARINALSTVTGTRPRHS